MKPVRFTPHARHRCRIRGTTEDEVVRAIREGIPEPAQRKRTQYRINLEFHSEWMGEKYAVKQVVPIVKEEQDEFVVITVYVFYF